jgi:hypothetical protein
VNLIFKYDFFFLSFNSVMAFPHPISDLAEFT